PTVKLVQGFEDIFRAPHSRYTEVRLQEVKAPPALQVLAVSEQAGLFLVKSRNSKHNMVTGHLEYDAFRLKEEYDRYIAKEIDASIPENYFPNDDVNKTPPNTCRSHTHLLFSNWLNYYVYQEKPYQ